MLPLKFCGNYVSNKGSGTKLSWFGRWEWRSEAPLLLFEEVCVQQDVEWNVSIFYIFNISNEKASIYGKIL